MRIKDLRLALSATPKKNDVRFYLNGILARDQELIASDGHRLCIINYMSNFLPENIDQVIIPIEAVNALLKKIGAKNDELEVIILLNNNRYELQCHNQIEIFTPINSKYPDFSELLSKIKNHNTYDAPIYHQFNWQYVGDAQRDINKYMGNTNFKTFKVMLEVGYFQPNENIIYIITPVRA